MLTLKYLFTESPWIIQINLSKGRVTWPGPGGSLKSAQAAQHALLLDPLKYISKGNGLHTFMKYLLAAPFRSVGRHADPEKSITIVCRRFSASLRAGKTAIKGHTQDTEHKIVFIGCCTASWVLYAWSTSIPKSRLRVLAQFPTLENKAIIIK